MELTLENIESLLINNPNTYNHCKIFKNDLFMYDFEFDEYNNIKSIKDFENNIAEYLYDDEGFPIEESIKYSDGEVESFYRIEKNSSIFFEIRTDFIDNIKFSSIAHTSAKYEYGDIDNKYLKKYHLNKLKSIYTSFFILYTVKHLSNGFEVYYDMVPVYRELYDDNDNLIETYIIDYNCITNTFKYTDNKISKQSVYENKDLLYEIFYTYNNNLLDKESIHYEDSIYEIYYYYNFDGSIYKIDNNIDSYKFIYE